MYVVHYQARHQADGSIIVDTRAEKGGSPVTIVAGRGVHVAPTEFSTCDPCIP